MFFFCQFCKVFQKTFFTDTSGRLLLYVVLQKLQENKMFLDSSFLGSDIWNTDPYIKKHIFSSKV